MGGWRVNTFFLVYTLQLCVKYVFGGATDESASFPNIVEVRMWGENTSGCVGMVTYLIGYSRGLRNT